MSIKIFDSKVRKVVPFDTREEGKVAMYCCGPTVYNYIHIGNARTMLWFEFIRRYFEYRGYDVTYVMNYTDVDDKIIERSKIEKITPDGIALKYTKAFEDDLAAMGAETPDIVSKATDHIGGMIEAIEGLVEKGLAYESEGNVWYSVEKFDGYGKLSGRTLDDMRAGERVEPMPGKHHPLDFSLWKAAKEGEPSWDSPWGPGRPGWHIECSVMSTKYLGMGFDVHGGGTDLIFPHHENEIAQAEGLEDSEFVRHWMHAGMVQMGAEKMSKSLGNIVLAHDAVAQIGGEVLRYWALSGSYRSQVVFSDSALDDARASYERWSTFLSSARHSLGDDMPEAPVHPRRKVGGEGLEGPGSEFTQRFISSMDDDFNSAGAFAAVHELVTEGNKALEATHGGDVEARARLIALASSFVELIAALGFGFAPSEGGSDVLVGGLVEFLLEMREQARAEKAFERADAIRDKLSELGVITEDTPSGTRWRLGVAD